MASVLRLRRWKEVLDDGKSSVEYGNQNPDEVLIAIPIGHEPAKIKSPKDCLDVEKIILFLADQIRASRKKKPRGSGQSAAGGRRPRPRSASVRNPRQNTR